MPTTDRKGQPSYGRKYGRVGSREGQGQGWRKGTGRRGDWSDPKTRTASKNENLKKHNEESRKGASRHREEWSEADLDRVMDDVPSPVLAKELKRTIAAVRIRIMKIREGWGRELDDDRFSYDGPVIYTPGVGEQNEEEQERYQAALRKACINLTAVAQERAPEMDEYEYMSLYAMLGLME